MIIEDFHIEEAERILLPNGCHFDDERIAFIKSLDTLDLMAVPGSGKTTALQAKLYCLAKQMPLEKGKGVLVLSHTNAAVDEIKSKLKDVVPQLLDYPNAVCTIQEFVDRFLAIPFYKSCFLRSIDSISVERYNLKAYAYCQDHFSRDNALLYFKNKYPDKYKEIRFSIDKQGKVYLANSIKGDPFSFDVPKKWNNNNTAQTAKETITNYYFSMKKSLLKDGILHYDDCYFLANKYITSCPSIIELLQLRFPFVFVDETQDLKKYQLDLLDAIFNSEEVCLQRIGDPNQSIYSKVSAECIWKPRRPISINKSLRLSKEIAEVVDYFTLERNNEKGEPVFNVISERETKIKPHLILYNELSVQQLKSVFVNLIVKYDLHNVVEGNKFGFHILGWNAEAKAEGYLKYHLEDIFSDYKKTNNETPNGLVLNDYLKLAQRTNDAKKAKRCLEDSICSFLRAAKIKQDFGDYQRDFTPHSLVSYLETIDTKHKYLLALYNTTICIKKTQISKAHGVLKSYIVNVLVPLFDIDLNEAIENYLDSPSTIPDAILQVESDNQIPLKIGTVHSAKGQTHCATMYVETWYEGHYETDHLKSKRKLPNPLYKQRHNYTGVYVREAIKMMYVGFSRPTHLLCLASQKEQWNDEAIQKMKDCGWEIVDSTTN